MTTVDFKQGTSTLLETDYLSVTRTNEETSYHEVIQSGKGNGSVVIAIVRHRGWNYVCVTTERRFPVSGIETGFPRGGSEIGENPIETAQRELEEETGVTGSSLIKIGELHPDNGIMSNTVSVVLGRVALTGFSEIIGQNFVSKQEPGISHKWIPVNKFNGLIAQGKIRCGITLAAWAILMASGELNKVVPLTSGS